MNFSSAFITRPVATSLIMAMLLLVGIAAYPWLPVAALPQIDFPTIQVMAMLPGADPGTMASTVAQPLESQFAQISGVSEMTSQSTLGQTFITLQFDLDRNIDGAAQDVQAAINAAGGSLPHNLPFPPQYWKSNPADQPILIFAVQSDTLPLIAVDDYAENVLAQHFSQVPGVSQVQVWGQQKPSIRVQVDPAKLASMGLSLEAVRNVLTVASVDAPKGHLDGDRQAYTIYADDQLTKAAKYNDIVIAYKAGAPIRIRDIGRAVDAPENAESIGWLNGKPGVQLVMFKQPGANVIDAVARVKAELPQLVASIPPSVKVSVIQDRTLTIQASVHDVQRTLMISIALVVTVIFIFLRSLWATIIPAIAVPLSLVGTFAAMYLLNFSIDNLSLMALTIATGFVVDDAIVMLENIYRYTEQGMRPIEAALKGASEIGFTIISISLSLVAVFIPLLLMGGIVGRLFREFALTVTMTIAISAFVSLTLTPMMCAHCLSHIPAQHGRFYLMAERGFTAMAEFYRRTLETALRYQRTTFGVFLLTVACSVALYIYVPKGFFPQQDTGIIQGFADGAQDISFAEMSRRTQALSDIVAKDPDIQTFGVQVGGWSGSNVGRFSITLKPWGERVATADEVIRRLSRAAQQVQGINLYLQASQDITVGGRSTRTQYQYTLQDADLDELNRWAPKILAKLKTLPGLRDVATDQRVEGATATMTIDRDQAARFGIQPQLIDDTLSDAFGQRQIAQYYTQVNTYHVILEVLPALRGKLSTLDEIYLTAPATGEQVPLSSLVKLDTKPVASLSVNHQGQFPSITISFNLNPGTALGDAVTTVEKASAELRVPASLTGTFSGTAQAFKSSLANQPYLIAAALIAVYVILGVLYESYLHPLTILSTLPSAGVGALLMLLIARQDLSVIALIGVILLIGIVKKNGIMMVDFAIGAERNQGLSPLEAIRQACLLRFRPIMMTSAAALFGGLPLMLGHGAGSEIRRPLGLAMVGGLLLSQVLTLYTTPVVYLYVSRLQTWLTARRTHDARARSPGSAPAVQKG